MKRFFALMVSVLVCLGASAAEEELLTYSPDSTLAAFTRAGDLYIKVLAQDREIRITRDGSSLIKNGYASWVYYEEIFGRPSKYRAVWWSPDGKTLAFYRFDDSHVPLFPIYSAEGQDGVLRETRYPKAGERNPEVKIGFVDVKKAVSKKKAKIVWADFDPSEDCYYGTPFFRSDSKVFYVQKEPRIQNTLDLFAVDPSTGKKSPVYHESVKTWLDWIDGMLFSDEGLYMVRSFEDDWQQIYFLSFDGKTLKKLTSDPAWRVSLKKLDGKGGLWFTARRAGSLRTVIYHLAADGAVEEVSDPAFHVLRSSFADDGTITATLCSTTTPPFKVRYADGRAEIIEKSKEVPADACLPSIVKIESEGFTLPGLITLPKGFDPSRKYPVHVYIYGGPDNPVVTDMWRGSGNWFTNNGIIDCRVDCRAAGHDGRKGLNDVYRRLGEGETRDFVAWAKYLRSLPYVDADRIGVEGFSFGGTMTARLLLTESEYFRFGIAGGGVYDWMLYDTHYTERFMSTPQDNPEGYASSAVVSMVKDYPVKAGDSLHDSPVVLKLTHGTGDDNVHFQNTVQLVNALQEAGKGFELMIYPDGMHGYRGLQAVHSDESDHVFWTQHLTGRVVAEN